MTFRVWCTIAVLAALVAVGCGDGATGVTPTVSAPNARPPQIAFVRASGNGVWDVGIAGARGQALRILTGESKRGTVWPQLFTALSWSPDGRRIAFAGGKGRQTDEHDEPTDIYVVAPDGSQAERLTDLGTAGHPVWSPDGETIVFTRTTVVEGRPSSGDLWSIKPDGSGLIRLTKRREGEADLAGSFSPDGSRLAVTRIKLDPDTLERSAHVRLVRADGSDDRRLISNADQPAFSPDGKRIAFASARDRHGRICYGEQCFLASELYVARANGKRLKRLTRTRGVNEDSPSWSPDGSRLAYQRGKEVGNAQGTSILQVNGDGSCDRKVLADPKLDTWYMSPTWRPGGRPGRLSC